MLVTNQQIPVNAFGAVKNLLLQSLNLPVTQPSHREPKSRDPFDKLAPPAVALIKPLFLPPAASSSFTSSPAFKFFSSSSHSTNDHPWILAACTNQYQGTPCWTFSPPQGTLVYLRVISGQGAAARLSLIREPQILEKTHKLHIFLSLRSLTEAGAFSSQMRGRQGAFWSDTITGTIPNHRRRRSWRKFASSLNCKLLHWNI